ncbi:putative toxin-antitoxin system toxin component, PIN family [Mucilaginibacter mallensis]|uniref:Putative toxin-antitoxin system toxin component, PIN family n=1 Tax=Mucilaginibacter mallensis TaxID=652787 RepID=A0A1H2C1D4_MUCMA|nr:putative toxin-antitoxin system toxin component, PIN family [Mucilaginibacter mallensis]SDT64251.1 putative toxin-antitoxin system toxin component, PIN family [Mucilaginibacter mallensis]
MKVVLDSNVLLVALGKKSRFRPIWNSFIDGKYQLIISDDIVFEYTEILQQHSANGIAEIILEIFIESPDIIFQQVYYNWNAIKADPDDNKFFDIAVAANADYLVTNDAHFNAVKNLDFPSIKIITADEFMNIINS